MKIKNIIEELSSKNSWEEVNPSEYYEELISLVQQAYAKTEMGSFVNSKRDAMSSRWKAVDLDDDPDLDATVFYREPRPGENWKNFKIRGIGHDNSREAINAVLGKLKEMLNSGQYWVEASGALEHILYKLNVPFVRSEVNARRTFPGRKLRFVKKKSDPEDFYSGRYKRYEGGKEIVETIFGKPKF